jgi:hypothetical protein
MIQSSSLHETTYDGELAKSILISIKSILFMRTQSYEAAVDYYVHGQVTDSSGQTLSLQNLCTDYLLHQMQEMFSKCPVIILRGRATTPTEIIMSALQLDGDGIFAGASYQRGGSCIADSTINIGHTNGLRVLCCQRM